MMMQGGFIPLAGFGALCVGSVWLMVSSKTKEKDLKKEGDKTTDSQFAAASNRL